MFGKAQHTMHMIAVLATTVAAFIVDKSGALSHSMENIVETLIAGLSLAHVGSYFHAATIVKAQSVAQSVAADAERANGIVQALASAFGPLFDSLKSQAQGASTSSASTSADVSPPAAAGAK